MDRRILTAIVGIPLVVSLLAGCGQKAENGSKVQESIAFESADVEQTLPVLEEEGEDTNVVTVSTEYGDLYYQEQWAEFMKTEQVMEDEVLTVSFMAEFNGQRYLLFKISVGAGEGDPVTQITDADGVQRDVFVVFEELIEYDELAQDEHNRLYAMQEEINFVVENLK